MADEESVAAFSHLKVPSALIMKCLHCCQKFNSGGSEWSRILLRVFNSTTLTDAASTRHQASVFDELENEVGL